MTDSHRMASGGGGGGDAALMADNHHAAAAGNASTPTSSQAHSGATSPNSTMSSSISNLPSSTSNNSANSNTSSSATASSGAAISGATSATGSSTTQSASTTTEPSRFIHWQSVTALLDQLVGGGVECALLFKADGTLLTLAGSYTLTTQKLVSALVANTWKTFEQVASIPTVNRQPSSGAASTSSHSLQHNELEMITISCDSGHVSVAAVSAFLVAVYADESAGVGLVQRKLQLAAEALKPLAKV